MDKKRNWLYFSITSIVLSILSLFLPIMSYQSGNTGVVSHYNIVKLLRNNELMTNVFAEYRGKFLRGMSYSAVSVWVILLCVVGVAAIILAFAGIKSMTKQIESEKPFRLTIVGLVGTAIPSVVLLILYLCSLNQYDGTMYLGAYIIVTPIAMVLACLTVTNRHRMTQEEVRLQREASAYIRPAGDLPIVEIGGKRHNDQ